MIEQAHISAATKQAIRDEIKTKGWGNIGTAILARILASPGCPPQIIVSPENLSAVEHKQALSHPLFAHFTKDSATQTSYIGYYNENEYWLFDEHRLENKAVLPGTGYLELARAVFVHCAVLPHDAVIELSEVYFLTPLMLKPEERREVRTICSSAGRTRMTFLLSARLAKTAGYNTHAERSAILQDKPRLSMIYKPLPRCAIREKSSPLTVRRMPSRLPSLRNVLKPTALVGSTWPGLNSASIRR